MTPSVENLRTVDVEPALQASGDNVTLTTSVIEDSALFGEGRCRFENESPVGNEACNAHWVTFTFAHRFRGVLRKGPRTDRRRVPTQTLPGPLSGQEHLVAFDPPLRDRRALHMQQLVLTDREAEQLVPPLRQPMLSHPDPLSRKAPRTPSPPREHSGSSLHKRR